MFLMVLGALVAFTLIIMIAANMIGGELSDSQADDPMRLAAVAERIKPLGQVNVGGAATETVAAAGPRSGDEVYQAVCSACHSTGVAEAPKLGDKAAWSPRVAQGLDGLVQVAISGKGAMPPRGGNPSVTDEELRAAIQYMLSEAGLDASGQAAAAAPAAAPTTTAAPAPAAEAESAPAAASSDGGADLAQGQQVYQGACFACHGTGVAGAPKMGDKDAWAPRIAQGSETLLKHALGGFQGSTGVMPPKGGRMDLSDADVTAAIAYMVSQSQ
jgi:cytochrome c5